MAWVKLDDQFPDHPKVDGLSDGAFRLHVSGLCHAGRYLTDGLIPKDRPSRLMAAYRPKYLKELTEAGLWIPVPDGYMIHDFTEWNKPRSWWEEKRAKDAKRLSDWRSRNGVGNDVTHEVHNSDANARPVPVPVSVVTYLSQSSTQGLTEDGLTKIQLATKGPRDHALKVAQHVLSRANGDVKNPTRYILKAIAEDPENHRYRRGNPTKATACPDHPGEWADACRIHASEGA